MLCPCCKLHPDLQLHLIFCSKLSGVITEAEYNNLFGSNEESMVNVIKKLEKKMTERLNILET